MMRSRREGGSSQALMVRAPMSTPRGSRQFRHGVPDDDDMDLPYPSQPRSFDRNAPFVSRPRRQKRRSDFHVALEELDAELQQIPEEMHRSSLYQAGWGVYYQVNAIKKQKKPSLSDEKLTQILRLTKSIVAGPDEEGRGDKQYREDLKSYHKLANSIRKFPFGKLLAGAMLTLIGVVLVVLSGIIAAASYGLTAPVSLFGAEFGTSMAVGGVFTVLGAFGAGSVMGGGITFFSATRPNMLRSEMRNLRSAARTHYGVK